MNLKFAYIANGKLPIIAEVPKIEFDKIYAVKLKEPYYFYILSDIAFGYYHWISKSTCSGIEELKFLNKSAKSFKEYCKGEKCTFCNAQNRKIIEYISLIADSDLAVKVFYYPKKVYEIIKNIDEKGWLQICKFDNYDRGFAGQNYRTYEISPAPSIIDTNSVPALKRKANLGVIFRDHLPGTVNRFNAFVKQEGFRFV